MPQLVSKPKADNDTPIDLTQQVQNAYEAHKSVEQYGVGDWVFGFMLTVTTTNKTSAGTITREILVSQSPNSVTPRRRRTRIRTVAHQLLQKPQWRIFGSRVWGNIPKTVTESAKVNSRTCNTLNLIKRARKTCEAHTK